MSRRYWLPLFAVVGLNLAGEVHAQTVRQDARGNASTQQGAPKPKTDAPPAVPIAVQNDIERIARALETANQKRPSPTEEDRAKRNLASQEKMADATGWAEGMFFLGLAEILITAAGVFLIYRTLIYTARGAADAKRSADAAEESLKETRRAANATVGAERDRLRPQDIFLQNVAGTFTAQELLEWDYIFVRFRNGGKSAANVVTISVNRLVTEALPDVPTYNEARAINPADQHVGALDPWEHISKSEDRPDYLIEPNFAAQILEDDGLEYWIYGYIDYFNFVGDLERLKFCGRLDLNRLATENYSHLLLGGPEAYTKN